MSGDAKLIFIENEGALFRGSARGWPTEVWSPRERKFAPYTGSVPKPIEWGNEITETEAINMMLDVQIGAGSAPAPRRRGRRGR